MCFVKMIHSSGILSNVNVYYILIMIVYVIFLSFHLLGYLVFIVRMCWFILIDVSAMLGGLFIFIGFLSRFVDWDRIMVGMFGFLCNLLVIDCLCHVESLRFTRISQVYAYKDQFPY